MSQVVWHFSWGQARNFASIVTTDVVLAPEIQPGPHQVMAHDTVCIAGNFRGRENFRGSLGREHFAEKTFVEC